jgi:hypothetical protein
VVAVSVGGFFWEMRLLKGKGKRRTREGRREEKGLWVEVDEKRRDGAGVGVEGFPVVG